MYDLINILQHSVLCKHSLLMFLNQFNRIIHNSSISIECLHFIILTIMADYTNTEMADTHLMYGLAECYAETSISLYSCQKWLFCAISVKPGK